MLYGNLKKTLRLNRTLALGVLLYYGLGMLWPQSKSTVPFVLDAVGIGAAAIFLLINEIGRITLKKFAESESLPLGKVCILMPILLAGFMVLQYVALGNGWLIALGLFSVLQAQLFGVFVLGQALLFAWVGFVVAMAFVGYPAASQFSGFTAILFALPVVVSLFHYGSFITALVKSASSQVNWLQSLATTDGLTGLINRRQFNHRLQAEMARARRHNSPLSLALFDLDDFKKVNDLYGHPVGDRILKELGLLISENIRESDVAARYGGEEFALILPETKLIEAYDLLERLRSLVERSVFCLPDNPLTATISIGVAQVSEDHTAFSLIEEADAALYEAKHQGKNRVIYGVVPTPKITYKNTAILNI